MAFLPKTYENRRVVAISFEVLDAPAGEFVGFGEIDARPRRIQGGGTVGPGKG